MSFGETIKRLRKEKGMTQDQLANLLNVTPQAISRWENNSAMPDISLLVPIANVFRVSTDTILEVNVEETEKQINDIILNVLGREDQSEPFYSERKAEDLREAIRRYPQDVRLKNMLVTILGGMILDQEPNPDPALFREQISLLEDVIEHGTDRMDLAQHKSLLASDYVRLKNYDRLKEMAEEAQPMECCREVLLPGSLTGEEQVRARKDLIFKCVDEIILTIDRMLEENTEDLTDREWQELNRARRFLDLIYGEGFSDYFVLTESMYKRVHGAVKRNSLEEAYEGLEEIIRCLRLKEAGRDIPESSLLRDDHLMKLCLGILHEFSIPKDARFVLERMKKDFDAEGNPRIQAIRDELTELSESGRGAFGDITVRKLQWNTFTIS